MSLLLERESSIINEPLIAPGTLKLSEIMAALSAALDITEGQPAGHAVRSALIGMRIAQEIQLSSEDRSALFYALLLKDLGCSSNAAKMAWLFGSDDREVKRNIKTVNWSKVTHKFAFALRNIAPGAGLIQKTLRFAAMAKEGERGESKMVETRCERGAEIARQFELPEATALAIRSLDEQWDGKGQPSKLKGKQIPLLARILNLAQTMEVFYASEGPAKAFAIAKERRGTWFDPTLVDAVLATRADFEFWKTLGGESAQDNLLTYEPADLVMIADAERLDRIAEGFARVVDAKSPWTYRHSTGVADIAVGIASILGFDAEGQRDIRRAGLLHDIGKLGVSNLILDKPGKPTDEEFAAIRKHPDYSQQILARMPAFSILAHVASAHHERLDGRGYHRQLPGATMPFVSRILAVADVYEALTAARPYRDGLSREKAFEIMRRDAGQGLCPDCIAALEKWLDRGAVTTRITAQLEEIDRLITTL